jgi:FAD linked oxidases, C-terminal domain
MSGLCVTSTACSPGTGEHGVGLGKRKYLNEELGTGTVELMKTVKRALDPYNLFNPGKVCPFLTTHEVKLRHILGSYTLVHRKQMVKGEPLSKQANT